jgi:RNA polymerase sigma factor (sigma-70 family)
MTTAHAGGLPERWDAVLEHRDRAFRIARARLSDPCDVDDCVQEGMARVVAMPNLDLGRVGPLLSTVVANVATDTHRKHSRTHRLQARLTSTEVTAQVHDEPVCDAAEARWLQTQLEALAPRERAVVEMRAEGRTVAQTATALGMTYKGVESAFTRGRTALKLLWRATLTALGAFVVRAWRVPNRTAGAAVLAAAASLILAVTHLGPGESPGLLAQKPLPQVTSTASQTEGLQTAARKGLARKASPHVRRPAPKAHVRHATPLVAVQPPQTHDLRWGGVRESRERPDESADETILRCVRKGLTVSPSEISCRG